MLAIGLIIMLGLVPEPFGLGSLLALQAIERITAVVEPGIEPLPTTS